MATTKNKNLFYLLYSTDLSVADSGYACSSAIDESTTSFDISVDEALITDSNGDILASLDLSSIHEEGLTQYNVETKILQPKSAYLLQGNEYGETYKQQYFEIPEDLSSAEDYQEYCNLRFDLVYKYKNKIYSLNVNTAAIRETYGSFTIIAQNQLTLLNANISISIKSFDDTDAYNKQIDYVNFQSTEEGYNFIIRNVLLTPLMADSENCNGEVGEFSDSPFSPTLITNDDIIDLLNKYQPQRLDSDEITTEFKVNCDIYKALMKLSLEITEDFKTFAKELEIVGSKFIPCFNEDGTLYDEDTFNELKELYPEIYRKYFGTPFMYYNMNTIYLILVEMESMIFEQLHKLGPHNCLEDLDKKVNNLKYPNGALRGIVLLPIWPTDEDTEPCSLWVNHVADLVEIETPIDLNMLGKYFKSKLVINKLPLLYEKAIATVLINALIPSEKQNYIEDYNNLPLTNISSNDGFTNSLDNLYTSGFDNTEYVNNQYHRVPIKANEFEDTNDDLWVSSSKVNTDKKYVDTHDNNNVTNIIGLYKYMEYLSNNDLWLRIGDAYMSIAKADDFLLNTKNLLQSLLIYNPNEIPIKIKYIIFS